jgi:hypothetical protein
MLLGVWVMLIPVFFGFPGSWNEPILIVSGILIVFIAYRSEPRSPQEPAAPADAPYVEHRSEPAEASPNPPVQDMIPPAAPPAPSDTQIIDDNAETAS